MLCLGCFTPLAEFLVLLTSRVLWLQIWSPKWVFHHACRLDVTLGPDRSLFDTIIRFFVGNHLLQDLSNTRCRLLPISILIICILSLFRLLFQGDRLATRVDTSAICSNRPHSAIEHRVSPLVCHSILFHYQ